MTTINSLIAQKVATTPQKMGVFVLGPAPNAANFAKLIENANINPILTAQSDKVPGIAASSSPTNQLMFLNVVGSGLIPVNGHPDGSGQSLFLSSASFKLDANSNVMDQSGHYLQAWTLDAKGSFSTSGVGNTKTVKIAPSVSQPTTSVTLSGNLDRNTTTFSGAYVPVNPANSLSSGAVTPSFSQSLPVYDANGHRHNFTASYLKIASNTWSVEIFSQPAADVIASGPSGQVARGTVTFNNDGSLAAVSPSLTQVPVHWTDGAPTSSIAINWGTTGQSNGIRQFSNSFETNTINQDGAPIGHLTSVYIGQNGDITASYDNGVTKTPYRVPLAVFAKPAQLQPVGHGIFAATKNSGAVKFDSPGQNGAGQITQETNSSGLSARKNALLGTIPPSPAQHVPVPNYFNLLV